MYLRFFGLRLIGTFDTASGPVREILSRHWNILTDLKSFVGTRPQVTYRQGTSLKDKLVKCHFGPISPQTNWLSEKKLMAAIVSIYQNRFLLFKHAKQKKIFDQGFPYLQIHLPYVVYKVTCQCGKEYIDNQKTPNIYSNKVKIR